jgi:hypothetical protein
LFPNNLPDEPLQVLRLSHIHLEPYDSGLMSGLFDEVDKAREVFLEEITGVDGLGACGGVLEDGGTANSGGCTSAFRGAMKGSGQNVMWRCFAKLIRQFTGDDSDGTVKRSSGHD